MKLSSFPRPKGDNGRGMHWSPSTVHPEGERLSPWLDELRRMNVKWVKVLDDGEGSSVELCRRLILQDMMPIVRVYRSHPNPGGVVQGAVEALRRLIDVGVVYFETNNEPDLPAEWRGERVPRDWAQMVAQQFIEDAETILKLGGLPGLPALSVGNRTNLVSLVVRAGRADLFARGAWVAVHAYTLNHPPDYPLDDVHQQGAPLTRQEYERMGSWAWDEQPRQLINLWRRQGKQPGSTIEDAPDGWRVFELADRMAREALGYSVPVLATEGGAVVGWRDDRRYPRVTPDLHRDWSVQINQFMQAEAPAYFFALCHWLLANFRLGHHVMGWESQAWFTDWWESGFGLRDHLPAVDAVREMPSFPRRFMPAEAEIRGLVSNPAGAGVYGVSVALLADGQPAGETATNARGRFHFGGLPAGRYEVRVAGAEAASAMLDLSGDASANVQLALTSGRRSILRGQALSPAGAPVSGVAVQLSGAGGTRETVSDAAGRFVFQELERGEYALSAGAGRVSGLTLDGWMVAEADIIIPPPPVSRFVVAERRLLEREETAGRRLLFGRVLDEAGAPLNGVSVELRWAGAAPGAPFPTVVTGSDPRQPAGYYEFANTPGRFELRVVADDAACEPAEDLDTAEVPGRRGEPLTYEINFQRQRAAAAGGASVLEVHAPGCPPEATITLAKEDEPARAWKGRRESDRFIFEYLEAGRYIARLDGFGELSRVEVDGFNRSWLRAPLCSAIVVEISPEAAAGRLRLYSPRWESPREVAAQPGQTLRFEGLPAGEYQVRYLGWRSETLLLDGERTVTLRDVRGDAPHQATLTGKVLNAEGEPAAGRRVLLMAGGEARGEQLTDADGRYQFSCLGKGVYSLHVEGVGALATHIALEGRESQWLDLALPAGARPKPLEHYVLLTGPYAPGVWAVILVLQEYLRRRGATVGFDWREASLARRATIIGDEEMAGPELEKRLLEAGCLVQRLPGELHELAAALARELH